MLTAIIFWLISLAFWLYFTIRAIICIVQDDFENPWIIPMQVSILCVNICGLIIKAVG